MRLAIAFITLALCQGAWALPRDLAETELFNEYADCAGYHMTRAAMLDTDSKEDEAGREAQLSTMKQFRNQAEALKTKDAANLAMFGAFRDQAEFARSSQGAMNALNARYAAACKSLLADPDARMKYWLTQGSASKGRKEQLEEVLQGMTR